MPDEFTHIDDLHADDDNLEITDTPNGDNPDGDNPDTTNTPDTPNGDNTPADGDNPDGDNPDGDNPDGDNPDADNDLADAAPGIEQFLAQYGISGGIITFETEEEGGEAVSKHFDELSPNEQYNVLSELATSGAPSMEAKYGLDENEIGLLNYVREFDGSVEEALNDMAQKRVDQIMAVQASSDVDFNSMSDDALVTKWLRENNPEASEEDIVAELDRSKESKFYESQAKTIRENYIREQAAQAENDRTTYEAEIEAEREEDRVAIATAAAEIQDVAGFVIDDDGKNEVLGKILEVNEYGDSLFMQEVFSNPEKLFKAAWLYYNADSHLDELTKKYDRDLANEYKKGRDYATNGMPSTPVNGVGAKPNNGRNPNVERVEKTNNLDSLWED